MAMTASSRVKNGNGKQQNCAITLTRVNFSGYVEHVTIFNWMLTVACCSTGLGLWLDLVSSWLVVMHTYLYYFPLSSSLFLSRPQLGNNLLPDFRKPTLS